MITILDEMHIGDLLLWVLMMKKDDVKRLKAYSYYFRDKEAIIIWPPMTMNKIAFELPTKMVMYE